MTKKQNPFLKNKHEIFYNLINSFIAGTLVFAGTLADGSFSTKGIAISLGVALLVMITKFQSYWSKEKNEYCDKINKALTFI